MHRAPRVACFGECMIELQGQAFGEMRQTFGGDTLNAAVYLARCGQGAGLQVDVSRRSLPMQGGQLFWCALA